MGTDNLIRDTMLGLQRAQIEREKLLRAGEQATARRVVEMHAETKTWSKEDLELVVQMLGLDSNAR